MRYSRTASTSCLAVMVLGLAGSTLVSEQPASPTQPSLPAAGGDGGVRGDGSRASSHSVQGGLVLRDRRMDDVGGTTHSLFGGAAIKVVVLVFLSTECPIANQSIPELNRIAAANESPEVRFFAVLSDRTVTRAQAARHHKEYRISFPVLFDASGDLLTALRPTHTPEAFVFDARGNLK